LQSIIKFSILITTKNRLDDLKITLNHLEQLFLNDIVSVVIYDDGSTDGTSSFVKSHYPHHELFRNEKSKGYIFCRNKMLNTIDSDYAISLDDDANFLSNNVLEIIESYFFKNPRCAVVASRIFWGKLLPNLIETKETPKRVKGFVGCGHIWNLKAWKDIPNYPEWFVFYGEEDFAAYQLFKKGWEVHYVPSILVHHRVDVKSRKNNIDYRTRARRSLSAGWYLIVLFYPLQYIPRVLAYSLWMQIKNKVFKGDYKASLAIIQAVGDVFFNLPKLFKNSYRFSIHEFQEFGKLHNTKIYWKPEDEQ
jgi:glycosyltransferase involved in cell wall biosynthesis